MSDPGSLADPVGRLAEDFMARYRRGERPALAEYTERYPELADRIRDVFPMLIVMEEADSGDSSAGDAVGSGPAGAADRVEGRRERIAGYRILREVGRGGMGVVYEAEQLALGRHVALKVLPDPIAQDARGLERFRREARAAARLHHTNIVPVHEVGQDGGVAFYAMQFIRGQPLDVVLDELRAHRAQPGVARSHDAPEAAGSAAEVARSLLSGRIEVGGADGPAGASEATAGLAPTGTPVGSSAVLPGQSGHSAAEMGRRHYDRSVARVGIQVAEALAYAHREGIIHRDIKPSNLLLDADSRVWITDFGLAKTGDDALTCTGDIIGTLRYMAPERFRGWSDPRSDVYSLGLTLYEMLVLRPAFGSADRLELIRQITHEEPNRPRKVDPRIPRDLETIVLKSIDKEPARRYPSADELAADLSRFVDREPIKARSVGPLERVWIWARRRPTAAALMLVSGVAALALAGAAVSSVYNTRLGAKNTQLASAFETTDRALALANFHEYFHHIARAHAGWREGTMAQVERLLDACPTDRRDWEWHYLKRQCHADLLTLKIPTQDTYAVAYSPDGTRMASGSGQGDVTVWDPITGRIDSTLRGHTGGVLDVAISPDGGTFASASLDKTVKVWDAATGRSIRTLEGHTSSVRSVAYSPAGSRLVSGGLDDTVRVWDLKTGREVGFSPLRGPRNGVNGVAYSPDGRWLASASYDKIVRVWDATTGKPVAHVTPIRGIAVAFSPDGRRLASGTIDGTVEISDVATGQPLRTFAGHNSAVNCVAFTPDGLRLITGTLGGVIKVWACDPATARDPLTLKGHTGSVGRVVSSPDGTQLASSSLDGTIKVWDSRSDPEARALGGLTAVFRPDGKWLASISAASMVTLWDTTTGQRIRTSVGFTGWAAGVAFSPDGARVATANQDRTVKLWSVADGEPLHTLAGHRNGVRSVAFSPHGEWIASSGDDPAVKLWDTRTGRLIRDFEGHAPPVEEVAFSPDGTRLATAGRDQVVRLWDVGTGGLILTLEGRHFPFRIAFSPDGTKLATAVPGRTIDLRDVRTGRTIRTFEGNTGETRGLAFTPDGRRLASTVNDGTVKLWDVESGREAMLLRGHVTPPSDVAFSPDGTRLATADFEGKMRLWDARPWTPDAAIEREALGLLDSLFARPLRKADVLDYLRDAPTIRPRARRLALSLADGYQEETSSRAYHRASWAVVVQPNINVIHYRFALLQAEHARRLAPDEGRYRTALGAAQYRTGQHRDALAALTSDEFVEESPMGLAFLAMARHRLGEADEARATLSRLRGLVAQLRWRGDLEARDLLNEAEALMATP